MSLEQWGTSMDTHLRTQRTCACGKLNSVTSTIQLSLLLISIWCAQKPNGLDRVVWFYSFLMALMELVLSTLLATLKDSSKMLTHKHTILSMVHLITLQLKTLISNSHSQLCHQTTSTSCEDSSSVTLESPWFWPHLKLASNIQEQFPKFLSSCQAALSSPSIQILLVKETWRRL